MKQIYENPTWKLMIEMVDDINLKPNQVISRKEILLWFEKHYPLTKSNTIRAHIRRMSTNDKSRLNHSPKHSDDLFFRIESDRFRLYEAEKDPNPIHTEDDIHLDNQEEVFEETENDLSEFAYERDLQSFLVKNLEFVEPGLILFEEDGIKGIEFDVGGRFVDILAVDNENNFVVIELKVSKGYDRVVGQLLRYVSWVRENMAEPTQKVRGVIIARSISRDLLLACKGLRDVQLYEYSLSISIQETTLS